jgi:hypothetical protein
LAPPKQTSNGQDTEEVENLFGNTKSLESSPTIIEEAEKVKKWRIYSATLGPRLDAPKSYNFFTLFVTSIFSRLHGVLNIGKK